MVLISIHPFVFRKTFLVLLALLGFSALCFADPVLMVHRSGGRPSPVGLALPEGSGLRREIKEKTQEIPMGGTAAARETTEPQPFAFQTQPYICALDALGDVTSAVFCSTTSGD